MVRSSICTGVAAEEWGLPLVGVALEMRFGTFQGRRYYERHNSDALMMNWGPAGGWYLALARAEHIQEALHDKSDIIVQWWPGTPAPPPLHDPHP